MFRKTAELFVRSPKGPLTERIGVRLPFRKSLGSCATKESKSAFDDTQTVRVSIEEEANALSTEVRSTADGVPPSSSTNASSHSWKSFAGISLTVVGCGAGAGAYALGRRYYRNNDYDVLQLELGRPRMYHFLTRYGLISGSMADKYSHYDYNLYCARLAAAILSDPNHAISSTEQLRSILQSWTQTELDDVPSDTPFTHATILALLSKVQSSPLFFAVYIMGERLYRVSPLSADIQSEINAFFEYAKEDEEGKRGVHKVYVRSILKHLQMHYHSQLVRDVSVHHGYLEGLRRESEDVPLLMDAVEALDCDYLSLIQLTNVLACANRQIQSETLLIYRLRLAAKKVDDDRQYQESLRHPVEETAIPLISIPILPLRKAEKQEEPEPKSIDEVLEKEIVNGAKKIDITPQTRKELPEEEKSNDEWWFRDCCSKQAKSSA